VRLFVNTDLQRITEQLYVTAQIPLLSVPRDSQVPIELQFYSNNVVIDIDPELTSGTLVAGNYYRIVSYTAAPSAVTISSSSVANPTVITTATPHGLTTGDKVTIASHSGSTPSINGTYAVTVTNANTFTIAVQVTVGGTGGTATKVADDFTSVGADSNDTDEVFVATSATPTTWQNGSTLKKCDADGNVLRIRWTVKSDDRFDQDPPLAFTNSFVKSGSGSSALYTGLCNYITEALNSGLGIDDDGAAVTITIATPAVCTRTAHGYAEGEAVVFSTTGSLPTGITAGTTYYVLSAGLTGDTFRISASEGGSAINTTGSQSGSHTVAATDVESVLAMAEVSWDGGARGKTNWIAHEIRNDLYRGSDGTPVTTGGASGKTPIGNGDSSVSVTFDSPLASDEWHFVGQPYTSNLIDAGADNLLVGSVTARSASGFTVNLISSAPSGNYALEWVVEMD
jgi:hypothetical protein